MTHRLLLLGVSLLLSPASTLAFAFPSTTKASVVDHPIVTSVPPPPATSPRHHRRLGLYAKGGHDPARDDDLIVSPSSSSHATRRDVLVGTLLSASTAYMLPYPVRAAPTDNNAVFVAGATGQTGRRILERLASSSSAASGVVIGGVRNVEKAKKSLSESSTVMRGAMVQRVDSISGGAGDDPLTLRHLDVSSDTIDEMTNTLAGVTSLIIAVGFVPGNPLKMNAAAHEVDNVGTCKLIDAAKAAGVKKVVMISSILSNGRAWGQEKSPGFVVTNAFGNVLDEKIVAEKHLRESGLDYTIVRPGGLKAKPPTGSLIVSGEDTLNAGEISRDLVADVCVACLTDAAARNRVLEIIEDAESEPRAFNGLNM